MVKLRVAMISKACIVGIYQRKLELIAQQGIDLWVIVPPSWRDERGEMPLERVYTDGYRLEVLPIRRNGDFHLHSYVGLGERLSAFQPHIVHIDEEPYNLAAWQMLFYAERLKTKSLFFSWQNIYRAYPPPFGWGERWVLNTVHHAIVGTESAAQVWREKGFTKPISVIPQFGTDPDLFHPPDERVERPFTIGYFGRLVEEKGIADLIAACARLSGDWRLILLGGGPQLNALQMQAQTLGIADRIQFQAQVRSTEMPALYHSIDVLVLPSRTRPNWKEQFGRVLVEAMCSGTPVIGSDSGAIPGVIGDAGLIFPEGDISTLHKHLAALHCDPTQRQWWADQGRARAIQHFTHKQVALGTAQVYDSLW